MPTVDAASPATPGAAEVPAAATISETAYTRRRANIRRTARRINSNRSVRIAARIGLGVNALVYILIGAIAVGVAYGYGGSASQSGALSAIAGTPGGVVLLWIGAGALWGLALWQLSEAGWVAAPVRRLRVTRRLIDLGKALGFAGIGAAAAFFAAGGHLGDADETHRASERLLGTPEGFVVLVVIGAIIGTIGGGSMWRGARRNFRAENTGLHGPIGVVVDVLGVFGYVAKGFSLMVVGALTIYAAIFTQPDQVGGLDGALKYLATLPSGSALLVAVGIGFVSYGLYLIARSVYLRTEER
jgi:hypothetical protein